MRKLFLAAWIVALLLAPTRAGLAQSWELTSPEHLQTFAYGSERNRALIAIHQHLGVAIELTNDPYVDVVNPRRFDDFVFNFPQVRLGRDGRTYFYSPPDGTPIAVAVKRQIFFGSDIILLPSSYLVIRKPHGLVNLTLVVTRIDHQP